LVRHRERQYWVRSIIQDCLAGDCAMLAERGAMGHPEGVQQSGTVPGLPEWEYYFHGCGCCLTHKVAGEQIDVDFYDDTAEGFCIFFYTKYLESLRNPEPPERRLLELHTSVRPIGIAESNLLEAGALIRGSGRDASLRSGAPRIAEDVLSRDDAIEELCQNWDDPVKQVWIAGMIGDWLAADEAAAGHPETRRITAPRAERCREIRRRQLLQVSGYPAADALFGLAELGDADDQLAAALSGAPGGTTSAALEIIGQRNDPNWRPQIYTLFKRVRSTGKLPQPHIWMTSLKFLLLHGYKKEEMIAALPRAGGTEVGEAVLLALEHAPEHALPLIRRCLLDHVPCNRTTVAAVLALISRPWSLRELLGALRASDDQQMTADARAALLETGDPEAEKAVLDWERINPHEAEAESYVEIDGRKVGPFYSMAEHVLKSTGVYLRYEMDELRDRVMKIRDVIPPEPPRPWWELWGR
jgi:hypothetical protein